MKIISFNVNGIRAALKKGLLEWIIETDATIICLQEIKLFETELVEDLFTELGFHCYWMPAQKKGYSGVAILTKVKPNNVEYGLGIELFDNEGRVISAVFDSFRLICAYFPSGTTGDIRQDIKMQYLDSFYQYIEKLANEGEKLVICGDVNICHEAIDIHNPKSNKNSSGFLPEEREWVTKFLGSGYVDTFRHLNNEPHNYTWWSYRAGARGKNLGWRIDYFFTSKSLLEKIAAAEIHPDVIMSDHCPISLELKV
ncbi:exodeoxyribonuclease-3 [Spirosomataceae bacterium TFI 002]|nr:exodeoxyribonuclease-3 [Spirosomataceae bacterium TFI 002]